ncbi:ROK family protein [Microlunatus endophyticus]
MESDAQELVAAVDLGGTFTKLGLIAPDGAVRAETRVPTRLTAFTDGDGGRGTVEWLGEEISAFAAAEAEAIGVRTVGFGVVVPGIVDSASGVVISAANIGWTGESSSGTRCRPGWGCPVASGTTSGPADWPSGSWAPVAV